MAYSEEVLRRAQARLAQEKADCESESSARIENIYIQYPRLREIDRDLRRSVSKAVAAAFKKGDDPAAAIEKIKETDEKELSKVKLSITNKEWLAYAQKT